MTAAIDSTRPASDPKSPDPRPDHLADAVGQGHLVQGVLGHPSPRGVLVDRAGLDEMAQHLAHEEWVAVGLPIHGMGEAHPGVVEGLTGGRLHEGHHSGVVESGQLDAGHPALAPEAARVSSSGWECDSSLSR